MKLIHKKESVERLCTLFGKTRRGYYKRMKTSTKKAILEEEILEEIRLIREDQPKAGTPKLKPMLLKKGIRIGRDPLNDILREHGMLIRNVKKYRPKQTDGDGNSIYPDLRKGLDILRINQLWCTDITYIELSNAHNHAYLVCYTDEYSHLIVGYNLALNMRAENVIQALIDAASEQLKGRTSFSKELIVHSDRGSQYKSKAFKEQAYRLGIRTSMCGKGMSHENPVAERLNGILKNELGCANVFSCYKEAKQHIDKAVSIYNNLRLHSSCEMLTPAEAHHKGSGPLKKLWRQRKPKSNNKDEVT